MSEIRAIKVESCRFCKHRKTSSLYDKGFCTNGEGFQLGEDFPSIPLTCPLPTWPSASQKYLLEIAANIVDDNNLGLMHVFYLLESLMIKLNVEVSDEPK